MPQFQNKPWRQASQSNNSLSFYRNSGVQHDVADANALQNRNDDYRDEKRVFQATAYLDWMTEIYFSRAIVFNQHDKILY